MPDTEKDTERDETIQKRMEIVQELYGIIPSDMTLEEARESFVDSL